MNPAVYRQLSEKEKIPLRIKIAEMVALEELEKGVNLKPILEWCVKNEQYCGAAGIKKALAL